VQTEGRVETAAAAAGNAEVLGRVGVVIIGRNEGLRLQRCFDMLPSAVRQIVYVDSGSTDDSVAQARRRGVEVEGLDLSTPFTAARARNAGLRRLLELKPGIEYVQFIDGDCELSPGWLPQAVAAMVAHPDVAVTCGRLRERFPDANVYHRLAALEWEGPLGDVFACGGIAMMRVAPLREAGGFTERLIAGEEPELCIRLRGRGHRVVRLGADMALHDVAMTRFGQWARRSTRAGYGTAALAEIHPAVYWREIRSLLFWGLAWPALVAGAVLATGGLGLVLLAAYPAMWLRIAIRKRALGTAPADAALFAASCLLAKFWGAAGLVKYHWNRIRGLRGTLIEYK
jgi:GT2 family glycosyltransferase